MGHGRGRRWRLWSQFPSPARLHVSLHRILRVSDAAVASAASHDRSSIAPFLTENLQRERHPDRQYDGRPQPHGLCDKDQVPLGRGDGLVVPVRPDALQLLRERYPLGLRHTADAEPQPLVRPDGDSDHHRQRIQVPALRPPDRIAPAPCSVRPP